MSRPPRDGKVKSLEEQQGAAPSGLLGGLFFDEEDLGDLAALDGSDSGSNDDEDADDEEIVDFFGEDIRLADKDAGQDEVRPENRIKSEGGTAETNTGLGVLSANSNSEQTWDHDPFNLPGGDPWGTAPAQAFRKPPQSWENSDTVGAIPSANLAQEFKEKLEALRVTSAKPTAQTSPQNGIGNNINSKTDEVSTPASEGGQDVLPTTISVSNSTKFAEFDLGAGFH